MAPKYGYDGVYYRMCMDLYMYGWLAWAHIIATEKLFTKFATKGFFTQVSTKGFFTIRAHELLAHSRRGNAILSNKATPNIGHGRHVHTLTESYCTSSDPTV